MYRFHNEKPSIKFLVATLLATFLVLDLALINMMPVCIAVPSNGKKSLDSQNAQAFLAHLRARVLSNWLPADGSYSLVLEVSVGESGEVKEVKMQKSTASELAIVAAKSAFESAQPLGRLPVGYAGGAKITLTFHAKVDPHGDSVCNLGTAMSGIDSGAIAPTGVGH